MGPNATAFAGLVAHEPLEMAALRPNECAVEALAMILGIVGAEARKFTTVGRERARRIILDLISDPLVTEVTSGECHLGGVDIWAHELTLAAGKKFRAFPPANHTWSTGYKPRNLQIAHYADKVVCLAVDKLPADFEGMVFGSCYHCLRTDHVKSGGCWTMKRARSGQLIIVRNF